MVSRAPRPDGPRKRVPKVAGNGRPAATGGSGSIKQPLPQSPAPSPRSFKRSATIKPTPRTPVAVPTDTPRRPFWTRSKAIVIACLAAFFAVVAVVLAFRPFVTTPSNLAFVDLPLTMQVQSQASTRLCSVFGVDYDNLDAWEKTVKANLIGEAQKNIETYLPAYRKTISDYSGKAGKVDCETDTMAVRSINGDTAIVLASMVVSATNQGAIGDSGVLSIQATLKRVKGQWLASQITQV